MASLRRPIYTFTNDERIQNMYLYVVFRFVNNKPEKVWEYYLKDGRGFYPGQQDKSRFIFPGTYFFFLSKCRTENPLETIKEEDCIRETVLTRAETGGLLAQPIKICAPFIISLTNDNPPLVFVKHNHLTKAHRLPVKLELMGNSEAKAELTCDSAADITVYDAETDGMEINLPYEMEPESLKEGVMLYIEAQNPKLQVKLDISPQGEDDGTGLKIDCIKVTLDSHKCRETPGVDPPAFSDEKKIEPGRFLHEQDGDLHHERGLTVLKAIEPDDFKGKITLFAADSKTGEPVDNLALYDETEERPVDGQTPKANPFEIEYSQKEKHTFWLQGNKVSTEMKDVCLRAGALNLTNEAGKPAYGDEIKVTVIKTGLELGKSRSAAGRDPDTFSDDDKNNIGRYLHIQDPGNHHGRAMIRIKKFKPDTFTGKFMLTAYSVNTGTGALSKVNPGIELYDAEVAAAGQAAHPNELEVDHNNSIPADGKLFWVQGKDTSSGLRDREQHLGIKEHIKLIQKAAFTVIRFKDLKAEVQSTRAETERPGNFPVPAHDLHLAGGAISAVEFDVDTNINEPLPLVEGSVLDSPPNDLPVQLSVVVEPQGVGVPVLWAIKRDRRPAPDGDAAAVIGLPGNREAPVITQDAVDPLKATCIADAVGTFHICPYVDCNGSGDFDFNDNTGQRIDREPHIVMNYVLMRVQGRQDNSLARPANGAVNPPNPTTATGVGVSTGNFVNGAGAGMHCNADVEVTGGGSDGKRGLDYLFGGWINDEVAENNMMIYTEPSPPSPPPPAAPIQLSRFTVWHNHGGGLFPVISNPAAVIIPLPGPFLDTTNFGNEGMGGNTAVGTEGAPGPPVPVVKVPNPVGIGEIWTIEMWDSPGDGCPPNHENSATAILTSYRFDLDFRTDLCFWTNRSKVIGIIPDDPACRLYSSVLTNTWTIRLNITFDIATGISNIVTPLATAMVNDANPTRIATPVQNSGLEVRFPITLETLVIDARN